MFTIHIDRVEVHMNNTEVLKKIENLHNFIEQKLNAMSEIVDTLNAKVDELQTTVDDVQNKITTRLAADDTLIADLKAQIAAGNGATTEQLQAILDKLTAANADLAGTTV